jgi:Phosphotransferase system cellobiose-specific component IIC
MSKLMGWLEKRFAPKMMKLNQNIWIMTLRDTMVQIFPFVLVGSIFCLLAVLQDYVSFPMDFWSLWDWSLGMVSIMVAFLIPFNYCEKKRLRKQRLVAGFTGLVVFLLSVTPEIIATSTVGFTSSAVGPGGMFCAIIMGILTSLVFSLFAKFSFFKNSSALPDFIKDWFDNTLPILICILGVFCIAIVANVNIYQAIVTLISPLQYIINTWWGFTLFFIIDVFIYSMGISTWVTTPISTPLKLAAVTGNLALIAAGTATAANMSLFTDTLIYGTYMWAGGLACTLPLAWFLFFSKSKRLKAIGRASIVPSLLNINEPIVFGCIAWNPILMIPMWLQGLIIPLLTWFFCKVIKFAPIPQIQFDIWYCPYPISTWISSQGSLRAILFFLISIAVSALIWYPFFKVYEKQQVTEELAEATATSEKEATA